VTPTPQQTPHRQSDFAREIVGLIEPAPQKAHGMQRDGHYGIGALQHVQSAPAHQTGQRLCKLAAPFELEGVNQFAQRAFVRPGASCHRKRGRPARATLAQACCVLNRSQLIAASLAHRGGQQDHAVPAAVTDRPVERPDEWPPASRAQRIQEQSNQAV